MRSRHCIVENPGLTYSPSHDLSRPSTPEGFARDAYHVGRGTRSRATVYHAGRSAEKNFPCIELELSRATRRITLGAGVAHIFSPIHKKGCKPPGSVLHAHEAPQVSRCRRCHGGRLASARLVSAGASRQGGPKSLSWQARPGTSDIPRLISRDHVLRRS